jgi:hypothetical protein
MGYVIAAYALVIGVLAVYGAQLARERRRLLPRRGESNHS